MISFSQSSRAGRTIHQTPFIVDTSPMTDELKGCIVCYCYASFVKLLIYILSHVVVVIAMNCLDS